MKINIDTKKEKEAVSKFLQKTSDFGKKTVSDVQASAVALVERSKQDSYMRRLKKYNPVFPDIFYSEEFNIPNMIVIRDDAERRGIDVCEGAIGWLSSESGMEVLYLYDEEVPNCGLKLIPSAECDAVYYVDSFDRTRFIRTDCIFKKAHEEKLAELKHIAHSLGAKACTIEINESNMEMNVSKKKASIGGGGRLQGVKATSTESAEQNASAKITSHRSGRITSTFEGSKIPQKPELKWFAHDEIIAKLIDSRLNNNNLIKTEMLELDGASSATMSQKTAYAIDNAVGAMKMKGSSSMESQAVKENHSTFLYSIEF
jgi:hypothetical protein